MLRSFCSPIRLVCIASRCLIKHCHFEGSVGTNCHSLNADFGLVKVVQSSRFLVNLQKSHLHHTLIGVNLVGQWWFR